MGEILNYYNNELKKIRKEDIGKFQGGGTENRKMRELTIIFNGKIDEANGFTNTIQKVDDNIDKLNKLDEKSPTNSNIQKALFDEVSLFQSFSKPNCLKTIDKLRNDLKEIRKKVNTTQKSLVEAEKSEWKNVGNRILNFFGLGKKNKDKNEDKIQDKEKIKNRKEIIKELNDCNQELLGTERQLYNSAQTLQKFKKTEKSLKDYQQKKFGIMTKKTVLNAIHNSTDDKGTGMIGCLIKVYNLLDKNYVKQSDIAYIAGSPKYHSGYSSSKARKNLKYDVGTIKYMKNMLTGDNPKHFNECKRKLKEFSELDIDLLSSSSSQQIAFDREAFDKYKESLKGSMDSIFGEISEMINKCAETLNNTSYDNINNTILNKYTKEIHKKQNDILKEYKKLKKDFTKNVKGLLPKSLKSRDKLADYLSSLAFFNCSTELTEDNKAIFDSFTVKKMEEFERKFTKALFVSGIVAVISIIVCPAAITVIAPVAVVDAAVDISLLLPLPLAYAGVPSAFLTIGGHCNDLDAISGSIIKKSRETKQ